MDKHERICRYLAACPPAISGQCGQNQTYAVACTILNGFDLSESETLAYLRLYNERCQPPWDDKDLARKANQATLAQHTKPKGYLIGSSGSFSKDDYKLNAFEPKPSAKPIAPLPIDPATAIEVFLKGFRCGEAELWDASPIKPSDDFTQDGMLLVRHLFRPGETVNFVTKFQNKEHKDKATKPVPDGYGESMTREAVLQEWELSMPHSDAGGWLRMNPTDGQGIADKNITAFRYILLEFDSIPVDLQICLFAKLPLPIACIMTSGGKSVHAWVKDDAPDITSYKDDANMLLKMLARFGLDGKNKNPSRLSRLPGVTRKLGSAEDGRQRLLYLNPNPTQSRIIS